MEPVFAFLFPTFIALYFLIGAVTGRLGSGSRGGRGPDGGHPIPGWARLVCLLVSGGFGVLSLFVLFRYFSYRR